MDFISNPNKRIKKNLREEIQNEFIFSFVFQNDKVSRRLDRPHYWS